MQFYLTDDAGKIIIIYHSTKWTPEITIKHAKKPNVVTLITRKKKERQKNTIHLASNRVASLLVIDLN